jgi:tetratricopeptide (TPR) repeat protein
LISELDEWLEKSKTEEVESAANGVEGGAAAIPVSQFDAERSLPGVETKAVDATGGRPLATGSAVESPAVASVVDQSGTVEVNEGLRSGIRKAAHFWQTLDRRRIITGATIAVAMGLLCVLALPLVQSHANPTVERSKYTSDAGETNSEVPYRSQVAGVDDLYLKGIYFYEQRTPESLGKSRDDFSEAIAKDPNYAPAYVGLANTFLLLREYSVMPDAVAYPKAKAAAEHAVALDPKLAPAHASLGFIDFFWSWDTGAAEHEFKTALALDPSSVLARHWYGSMLTHEGRYKEALEQLDIAQRLEPTSAAVLSTRAMALGLSGHRGEAVDLLQDVINETPGVSSPHEILANLSKVAPEDPARFLDETRRVAELRHSDEMLQIAAAADPAYRTGGETAMWQAILTTEERLHPGAGNRTYLMADAEAALGRKDAAFADLAQLARRRDPQLIGIIVDPTLASLREDPRFGRLVAVVGLPPLDR